VAGVVAEAAVVATVGWVECHTAALAAEWHVAALMAECHAAASLVAEWARAARAGAVLVGTVAEIGVAITAMVETGMATIGTAGIIMATM